MCTTKTISNAFITDDIIIKDFDFSNIERYQFTVQKLNPKDYKYTGDLKNFRKWANNYLSYEELYQIPMMTSVYYYPTFVDFKKEDCCKTTPNTTLFYDIQEQSWVVGLTGGGMDLAPHLLETFIRLASGIPLNVANAIRKNYSAYIDKEIHQKNCNLLANAFDKKITQYKGISERLKTK